MINQNLEPDRQEDKVEVSIQKEEKKEVGLLGSQRVIPGHKVWEYNWKEHTLGAAEYEDVDKTLELKELSLAPGDLVNHRKIVIKENCHYFQKLNRTNAVRYIRRKLRYYGKLKYV